jgi:hypothetical protein
MHFIGQAKIIKILKIKNNIIICEYLPARVSHGRRVCENLCPINLNKFLGL